MLAALNHPVESMELGGTVLTAWGWLSLKAYRAWKYEKKSVFREMVTNAETGEEVLYNALFLGSAGSAVLLTASFLETTGAWWVASAVFVVAFNFVLRGSATEMLAARKLKKQEETKTEES